VKKIVIRGGRRLEGSVGISGAKNAALPIIAATLLTQGPCVLNGVPRLEDVTTMLRLLESMGVDWHWDRALTLNVTRLERSEAPYDLVKTMRASVLVLGPLVARFGHARVALPGGCAIGARPINLHLKGLEALGAKIDLEHGYVTAHCDRLRGGKVYFDIVSVTGTENMLMAASLAEGVTDGDPHRRGRPEPASRDGGRDARSDRDGDPHDGGGHHGWGRHAARGAARAPRGGHSEAPGGGRADRGPR
jgi:UDP-N-acetylglucosamine 1-carboxyvinyltransferase